MNKRQRKKQNNNSAALCTIPEGVLAGDLLYKPIAHGSGGSKCDFDIIMVPFKIQGDKLFLINAVDVCSVSFHLEYVPLTEGRISGYWDISEIMKECLEVQEETGVTYYYGKLDKAYQNYMYILRVLISRNIITKKEAKKLILAVDFDEDRFDRAANEVEAKLESVLAEERRAKSAGDMILGFLQQIIEDEDE